MHIMLSDEESQRNQTDNCKVDL